MSEYISQTPVNGFPLQKGSHQGCELTFEYLQGELSKGGIIKKEEVISQVSVTDKSIILYFEKKKRKRMKYESDK